MMPSLTPGAGPTAFPLQRAVSGIGGCVSPVPPRSILLPGGWVPTGWAAGSGREVPGKHRKAPGCGVSRGRGGCRHREEVCCGFLKHDACLLALAADQLQPVREAVAAGDGLWGWSGG